MIHPQYILSFCLHALFELIVLLYEQQIQYFLCFYESSFYGTQDDQNLADKNSCILGIMQYIYEVLEVVIYSRVFLYACYSNFLFLSYNHQSFIWE